MALTGWTASDYLKRTSPTWPGSLPYAVSMWLYIPAAASGLATAFVLGQDGLNNHRRSVQRPGDGTIRVHSRDASATSADLGASPTDQWFHVAAFWDANNARSGEIDGAGLASDSTLKAVAAPDSTFIGVRPDLASPFHDTGAIASVSVWDTSGFTAQDALDFADLLAGGDNPLAVNTDLDEAWEGQLVDYVALNNPADLGNYTEFGTLQEFATHPPVDGEGERFSVVLWETSAESTVVVATPFSVVLWESTIGTAAEAPVEHDITGDVPFEALPESQFVFTPEGAPTHSLDGQVIFTVVPQAIFQPLVGSGLWTTYEAVGQREDLGIRRPLPRRFIISTEPEELDELRRNLPVV